MALVLKREKTQKQNTIKSPQLTKAIGLLEKSSSEIQQVIRAELQSNPVLEEGDIGDGNVEEIYKGLDGLAAIPDVPFDGQLDTDIITKGIK